jgi:hypothetical protein
MYTVTITITESDVQQIIDELNYHDESNPLTLDEVKAKPELLKYLVESLDFKELAMLDLEQFWNSDGWADVENYR